MFHARRIDRIVVSLSLAIFVFTGTAAAQGKSETISRLSANPKLRHPQSLERLFEEGSNRARFLVRIKGDAETGQTATLSTRDAKERRRADVRAAQEGVIRKLKKVRSTDVKKRFDYVHAFAVEADPEQLEEIVGLSEVLSVEEDPILELHTRQGIALIRAPNPEPENAGEGVTIAVCDSGVDYRHPVLGGGGFPNAKVIGGWDTGNDDPDPMDENGHGTAVSGIAAGSRAAWGDYVGGVAPGAKLAALKVTHSGGSAYESNIIEAWEWCITHQYDRADSPIMIVTISMGGGRFTGPCDLSRPVIADAAAAVRAASISIFASSGNDGYCDGISYPACLSGVISVGAVFDAGLGGGFGYCVDPGSCAPGLTFHPSCDPLQFAPLNSTAPDQVTPYSNSAPFLDLFSPSHNASAPAVSSGYVSAFGGTSASSPYAAGAAAVIQSTVKRATGRFLSPAELKAVLIGGGDPVTDSKVPGVVKPRVNVERSIEPYGRVPSPPSNLRIE